MAKKNYGHYTDFPFMLHSIAKSELFRHLPGLIFILWYCVTFHHAPQQHDEIPFAIPSTDYVALRLGGLQVLRGYG